MPFNAAFFFILLPWLNPFASGPTPSVVPLLFSWACSVVLLVALNPRRLEQKQSSGWNLESIAAWAWLVAGLISSLIGLTQYFGAGASFGPWINQTGIAEAFANLRQRNQFATLTNMALATLLWLAMTGRRVVQRQWLFWGAAVLLAAGCAASSSRTGFVQLVLLCMLFVVWGGWRQRLVRHLLLGALFSYVLATLLLPWFAGLDPALHGSLARLRSGDAVCASRLTLWSNVLQLIAQKPWLGWGWGELDYAHYITRYPGDRFCDMLDNAHNLPLHLAVELGVPFALLVCGIFAWLIWRARPWRETHPSRQMAWAVLALIGLHSLLEYPLWYGPFQMAFCLCVYLLWLTREQKNAAALRAGAAAVVPAYRHVSGRAAALMLVALAYAAWDYHRVSQIYLAPAQRDPAYRDNTLEKIRDTRLFLQQFDFAALSLTPLTPENAQWTFDTAQQLLHYSPEPRVIEKVIESAIMLQRDDEVMMHLARYRAAFPKNHAQWRRGFIPTQQPKRSGNVNSRHRQQNCQTCLRVFPVA